MGRRGPKGEMKGLIYFGFRAPLRMSYVSNEMYLRNSVLDINVEVQSS